MTSEKHKAEPGTKGGGNFYRINVRPKTEFVMFRNHDIGKAGHIERIAGKRNDGTWDTQCWLVEKADAKISNNFLVAKIDSVKDLFSKFTSAPKLIEGDVFQAQMKNPVKKSLKIQSKEPKYKQENKCILEEGEKPLLIE